MGRNELAAFFSINILGYRGRKDGLSCNIWPVKYFFALCLGVFGSP